MQTFKIVSLWQLISPRAAALRHSDDFTSCRCWWALELVDYLLSLFPVLPGAAFGLSAAQRLHRPPSDANICHNCNYTPRLNFLVAVYLGPFAAHSRHSEAVVRNLVLFGAIWCAQIWRRVSGPNWGERVLSRLVTLVKLGAGWYSPESNIQIILIIRRHL